MIFLNDLDEEHPLRNTPLGELDALYRWKDANKTAAWRTVKVGAPKLINSTFNELGDSWTEYDWWGTEAWDEDRMDTIGQNGNTGDHYGEEEGKDTYHLMSIQRIVKREKYD